MQIISDYLAWNQEKIECNEEQEYVVNIETEQEEAETDTTEEKEEETEELKRIYGK